MSNKIRLRYNISSWPQLNLNYWGIPKCGNTSVKYALLKKCNVTGNEDEIMQWVHNHAMSQYIDIQTAENNRHINFTVTRDPYERFLSMYSDILRRPKHFKLEKIETIDQFIDYLYSKPEEKHNLHFWTQTRFIAPHNVIIPTCVIDVHRISNGFMGLDIGKFNTTNNNYRLTQQQKERVFQFYKKDFELLDYDSTF